MLWSIIAEDVVWAGAENCDISDGQVGSCACRIRRAADGTLALERLLSTAPGDFLKAELAPGRKIYG